MVPVANDSTAFVRIATDMRADGYERQVALGRDKIEIARRMRGIDMRLSVPVSAYQGVVLGLLEGRQGTIYRVSLLHADPDLTVVLDESYAESDISAQWRSWASYFSSPALIEHEPGVYAEAGLAIAGVYGPSPRRRNATLTRRRPRFLARRRKGIIERTEISYAGEREIVCYE